MQWLLQLFIFIAQQRKWIHCLNKYEFFYSGENFNGKRGGIISRSLKFKHQRFSQCQSIEPCVCQNNRSISTALLLLINWLVIDASLLSSMCSFASVSFDAGVFVVAFVAAVVVISINGESFLAAVKLYGIFLSFFRSNRFFLLQFFLSTNIVYLQLHYGLPSISWHK